MARTQAEKIDELRVSFIAAQAKIETISRDVAEVVAGLKAVVQDNKEASAELAALRQEVALVRQRLDDHLKRVELWDTRRWGLVVSVILALFGSALAFASGLLLATLRAPTK